MADLAAYREYRARQEEYYGSRNWLRTSRDKVNEIRRNVNALEDDPSAVERCPRKIRLCEEGETVIIYNPLPRNTCFQETTPGRTSHEKSSIGMSAAVKSPGPTPRHSAL